MRIERTGGTRPEPPVLAAPEEQKFLRLLKKFLCDPALDCELEFLNIIFEQMDCCCFVGDFREKVHIGEMRFQDKGWMSPCLEVVEFGLDTGDQVGACEFPGLVGRSHEFDSE